MMKKKKEDWPEQSFQVLRQLSSACISWVHGDEKPNSWYHTDLFALENEAIFLVFNGVLDGLDLNSHHRQYFNGDAVKLIKAAPRSCLCQTFVDVTNRLED